MPSRNWNDDEVLMRDLREALRPDPVEPVVAGAAKAAFRWGASDPDLELATLTYDSYVDGAALVRGPLSGTPRTLVFGRGDASVEIELTDSGIEGQLVPAGPGPVRLVSASGVTIETTADEVGCFAFPAQRGPVRLECTFPDGRFATEFFTS